MPEQDLAGLGQAPRGLDAPEGGLARLGQAWTAPERAGRPGPDPAAEPPADAPDPTLTALAERIRELQALAARPSPGGSRGEPAGNASEPRGSRSESAVSWSEPAGSWSEAGGSRSEPRVPRAELAGAGSELAASPSEPPGTRREPRGSWSEPRAFRNGLADVWGELAASRKELADPPSEPPASRSALPPSRSELAAARSELADARSELAASRSELAASRNELAASQSELADARSNLALPVSEPAVSGSDSALSGIPDVSQSRENSGIARQDYFVSDPRAAQPPSAADGVFAVRDDPALAPQSRSGEYLSSQGYTSGQEHRAMDRRRGPADGASMPQDRPAKGSLAELRLRLERLPAGHPSSPYDETGARRPAPEQLRQLELPLADEDEHPIRSSLLASAADDRGAAVRPASSGQATAPVSGLPGAGLPSAGFTSSSLPGASSPSSSSPSSSFPSSGLTGLAEAGDQTPDEASDEGLIPPAYDEDDFSAGEPGLSDPGLDEADQHESVQYDNGRPGPDEPYRYEPDRYEPGLSRNGLNGSVRNGNGAGHYSQDEDAENESAQLPAFGDTARNGARRPGELAASEPRPPAPVASALPPRSGSLGPDDLAASGLMPPVADPLAPASGSRSHDDADTSSFMPRPPAAAGDAARSYGNGSPEPDDLAAPGRTPRAATGDPLPVRNGSRGHDDSAAASLTPFTADADPLLSGLMPRAATGEPLPIRNGSRDHDDPAAASLMPRAAGGDALPARSGSRSHDDPAAASLMPRAGSGPLPVRNGSARPGRLPGSGAPPNGGGRDDPFSSDWQAPDPAADQNELPRGSSGLDELERLRASARSAPAGYDSAVSSPSGAALPGAALPAARLPAARLPGERLPAERLPGGRPPAQPALTDQVPGPPRPAERRRDGAPRRPHDGLTPEQEAIADEALSRYKAADGRNVFGGYGESGLTPAMRRVEAHLPHGRLAPDSEEYSLKSPERFKDKLARMIARHPGIPAAELAAEIYDAARYTFVFEPEDYTDGTWLVHRRLKAQGFDLEARRNRWDTPEFKGIRTRWRDPAHDLAFEVQFHTPASWAVVQRTHEAYLRITDPRTSPGERAELRERQVAAAAGTRPPSRCAEIGDFRADVR